MSVPLTVRDVMTRQVVTVLPGTAFKQVAAALATHRISAVPVVRADDTVVGVVSASDLLPKEGYRDRSPSRRQPLWEPAEDEKAGAETAEGLMTSPAVTVRPGAPLSEAARMMAHRHVKRLPVVDEAGRLIGLVSRGDVLRAFLRPDADLADAVRAELSERLPGLDPQDIDIAVEDGVVTLFGDVVSDARYAEIASRLIQGIEGVVTVHNRLGARSARRTAPPTPGPLF
jgi:CBS domain-containing protein